MEKDMKKCSTSPAKGGLEEKSRAETEHNLSDCESGRGTGTTEKSTGSTLEPSDSTSGIELKCDTPSEVSRVPELSVDTVSTPDAENIVPLKRSPLTKKSPSPVRRSHMSPVKTVKEGLRWVKKTLSPKKSDHSDEESLNPNEGAIGKSPTRSPIRSLFQRKARSPGKKKKEHFHGQKESFLLGDELRRSSSSEEEQKTTISPRRDFGAIPKVRHQERKRKERSPIPKRETAATAYERMDEQGDDTENENGDKSSKTKDKLHRKERQEERKTDAESSNKERKLLPLAGAKIGKWSPVRMTPNDEYTQSPSETDLDSWTTSSDTAAVGENLLGILQKTQQEVASAGERMTKNLDLTDPERTSGRFSRLEATLKWSPVAMTPDDEYTPSASETDMDLDSLTSETAVDEENVGDVLEESQQVDDSVEERRAKHLDLADPEGTSENVSCPESTFKGTSCDHPERQMEMEESSENVEMENLPDPGPSPKKLPKYHDSKSDKGEIKDDITERDVEMESETCSETCKD